MASQAPGPSGQNPGPPAPPANDMLTALCEQVALLADTQVREREKAEKSCRLREVRLGFTCVPYAKHGTRLPRGLSVTDSLREEQTIRQTMVVTRSADVRPSQERLHLPDEQTSLPTRKPWRSYFLGWTAHHFPGTEETIVSGMVTQPSVAHTSVASQAPGPSGQNPGPTRSPSERHAHGIVRTGGSSR